MAKKKETHEVIQWLGRILTIFTYLQKEMEKRALSITECFKFLATPDGKAVLNKLVEALAEQFHRASDVLTVLVNYGHCIADKNAALLKSGKLTYIGNDIGNYRYPLDQDLSVGLVIQSQSGKERLRFKLVRSSGHVSLEGGRDQLKKAGLRPALPTEGDDFLLDDRCFREVEVLRQRQPGDKKILIAMLSSVFVSPDDHRNVTVFVLSEVYRSLVLRQIDDWCGDAWYFLGVCKD